MHHGKRFGFTLIELIAALSLTGFVLLGAALLLDQVNDSSNRIAVEGKRVARDENGMRLLGRLLGDAAATADTAERLLGDDHSVSLWTWCDVPGGWMTPCRASLTIDQQADSSVIDLSLSTGESFPVRRQPGHAEFRYYDPSSPTDTVWLRRWSSGATLPTALGVVLPTDTIVYPIGVSRE